MDKETLLDIVNTDPFTVFEIEIVGGKRIQVDHAGRTTALERVAQRTQG